VIEMSQVLECKQLRGQGMSIRAISRRLGVARNTVRRYLRGEGQPGAYTMSRARSQPARDVIRDQIVSILVAEKKSEAPKKQRLTAARIRRLLDGDGSLPSLRTVQQVVREERFELRDPLKHAYLPLAYAPGEDAQVDFFEAEVDDVHDGRIKVFVLLVRACFSGRCFAYVAPNQTREALLEGLMQSFDFFGGVFRNLWFDNLTPAVRKVLRGRDRVRQKRFASFEAFYGFNAQFCSPGKGNEKGGVEGMVRFSRHETLTPIPTVDGRRGVQALFDKWMEDEAGRTIRGRKATIGEQWEQEVCELMDRPPVRFEVAVPRQAKVSNRSWVQTGTNYYSVPVEWVGRTVDVRLDAERVRITGPGGVVVEHGRVYGSHEMVLELEHYLPLLERKHRGLDRAVPMQQFLERSSGVWKALLAVLRQLDGEVDGSKTFVAILQLCPEHGVPAVEEAIESNLRQETISLESVRYRIRTEIERKNPRPEPMEYAGPIVAHGSIEAYSSLQTGGGASHV